ncbi:MAG: hypothetical protein C4287_23405 [Leptolyngbya sp. ERB_1_2]
MKKVIGFVIAVAVVSITIVLAGCDRDFSKGGVQIRANELALGPCWFLSAKGFDSVSEDTIKARQDREMYGYPSDTRIGDALAVFNEEQRCLPGAHSDLTENEILAALGTSEDYGNEDLSAIREAKIMGILTRRVLPKGSLLVGEQTGKLIEIGDGFRRSDDVKTIDRIYLFFDLDKKGRIEGVDRSQIVLIRKMYIGK